jgi:hypothetical protein
VDADHNESVYGTGATPDKVCAPTGQPCIPERQPAPEESRVSRIKMRPWLRGEVCPSLCSYCWLCVRGGLGQLGWRVVAMCLSVCLPPTDECVCLRADLERPNGAAARICASSREARRDHRGGRRRRPKVHGLPETLAPAEGLPADRPAHRACAQLLRARPRRTDQGARPQVHAAWRRTDMAVEARQAARGGLVHAFNRRWMEQQRQTDRQLHAPLSSYQRQVRRWRQTDRQTGCLETNGFKCWTGHARTGSSGWRERWLSGASPRSFCLSVHGARLAHFRGVRVRVAFEEGHMAIAAAF